MKILCILQNAWGDRELPVVFIPNPHNKSAKVIRKMVGEHSFRFSNTTDVVTPTANGKPKPDFDHFQKVIPLICDYDLILVCGVQAKETVQKALKDVVLVCAPPMLFIPHPASRSLSNVQIDSIRSQINDFNKEQL